MLHEILGAYYCKDVKNCHNGKTLSFAKLQLPISYHSRSCWYLGSFFEIALYVLHNYPNVSKQCIIQFSAVCDTKNRNKTSESYTTNRVSFHKPCLGNLCRQLSLVCSLFPSSWFCLIHMRLIACSLFKR